MPNRLTPAASRAVQCALRLDNRSGGYFVRWEALLLCLLRQPECQAHRVLREAGVDVPAIEARLEARAAALPAGGGGAPSSAERDRIMTLGLEQAALLGAPEVATEHLLLAMVRKEGTAAARFLEAAGADYSRLFEIAASLQERERNREAEPRSRADVPKPPEPPVVGQGVTWLMLHLLCWGCVGGYGAWSAASGGIGGGTTPIAIASVVWTALSCIGLASAITWRKPWAWGVVMAFIWAKDAVGATILLVTAVEAVLHLEAAMGMACLLPLYGLYLVLALRMTEGLFRARWWFGVDPRRGWKTLLQHGWWMLLVTGILDFSVLAAWLQALRF